MPKVCDNKSVGILVWRNGKLLMIWRKKYNFGVAAPAGHEDGYSPAAAARKELKEEVGLTAKKLRKLLEIKLNNPCGRAHNQFHVWTFFEASRWSGKVKRSKDETKKYFWATPKDIRRLTDKFEGFARHKQMPLTPKNLRRIQIAANHSRSWKKNPGLEPPMYFPFKKLGII